MAGKNKQERGFRLLWDGDDLSGDLVPGSVTGGGLTFDEVSMHGVSETVRNYLAGYAEAPVAATFVMNDNQTAGVYDRSYVLCRDLKTTGTLTLQWGSNGAAPTTGDPEWEGTYILLSAPATIDSDRWVINGSWQPTGAVAPAWGTVT